MPVSRALSKRLGNVVNGNRHLLNELIAHLENRDPSIPPTAASKPTPAVPEEKSSIFSKKSTKKKAPAKVD